MSHLLEPRLCKQEATAVGLREPAQLYPAVETTAELFKSQRLSFLALQPDSLEIECVSDLHMGLSAHVQHDSCRVIEGRKFCHIEILPLIVAGRLVAIDQQPLRKRCDRATFRSTSGFETPLYGIASDAEAAASAIWSCA